MLRLDIDIVIILISLYHILVKQELSNITTKFKHSTLDTVFKIFL